jgi:hypothetical protein
MNKAHENLSWLFDALIEKQSWYGKRNALDTLDDLLMEFYVGAFSEMKLEQVK